MKIRQLNINATISVDGVTFNGLNDLLANVEATYNVSSEQMTTQHVRNYAMRYLRHVGTNIHVGLIEERYPCFDSEDSLNETRYYKNFIFRNHKITENDFTETLSLCPMGMNCCLVTKRMPESMAPLLYYEGEGKLMLFAEV